MKFVGVRSLLLVVLVLTEAPCALATVDVCATNEWTGEAHMFDQDDYLGLGWDARPGEHGCDEFQRFAAENGYELTGFPHKMEGGLFGAFALLAAGAVIRRRRALHALSH